MSLQVWLPLNGNLNNNGLYNYTPTNTGATIDSSGKIGSCYSFDGSDDSISVPFNSCITSEWSVSLWFYKSEWGSKGYETLFGGPSGFEIESKSSSTNEPYVVAYNWGSGKIAYSLNTWNHLVITRTESETKWYLNGELKLTGTTGSLPSGENYSGAWKTSSHHTFKGKINDFRLYDNCLSLREVKEISKGLVLHYPLSDPYIESTTNLYTAWNTNCYNGATGKYSYGTNTDIYYTTLSDDTIKVYMGTAGNAAYPYIFFNPITPDVGGTKTLSFDYYPTSLSYVVFYSYNTSGTIKYVVNGTSGTSGTIPVVVGRWNHLEVTITNTGSSTSGYGYMRIGASSHTSTTTDYWLFKNIQIEVKDHATGYAGKGATRASTIEYDVSGYGNDAVATSTTYPLLNSNTPRNKNSYYFYCSDNSTYNIPLTSAKYLTNDSFMLPKGDFTLSFWTYKTTNSYGTLSIFSIDRGSSSNYITYGISSYDNMFCFNMTTNDSSTTTYSFASKISSLNTWYHHAFILNGTTLSHYVNNSVVETKTVTSGSYLRRYSNGIILGYNQAGGCNRYYNGYLSDFRIYVTALSASDIQELYNTPISVVNNGTLMTQGEFIEE